MCHFIQKLLRPWKKGSREYPSFYRAIRRAECVVQGAGSQSKKNGERPTKRARLDVRALVLACMEE